MRPYSTLLHIPALHRQQSHTKLPYKCSILISHTNFPYKLPRPTDTTSVADKWGAVMAQERFYKTHFHIDLKHCREHLGLHNNSWNGAVMGYLY